MAIFLTGDTHGDFSRFRKGNYAALDNLTKEDYVIICGDFGGVWCNSPQEQALLDWLDGRPFTTLFVDGNHENYDLLETFPVSEWQGGEVQYIRPSILHLRRGQIYTINGKTFFTLGGASCHDIPDGILEPDDPLFRLKKSRLNRRHAYYRINHQSWWKEELPSAEELENASRNLDKAGRQVDYIITHCCPSSLQQVLTGGTYPDDALTLFLENIRQSCDFQLWFFGHYHANHLIEDKFILLYEKIVQLV